MQHGHIMFLGAEQSALNTSKLSHLSNGIVPLKLLFSIRKKSCKRQIMNKKFKKYDDAITTGLTKSFKESNLFWDGSTKAIAL